MALFFRFDGRLMKEASISIVMIASCNVEGQMKDWGAFKIQERAEGGLRIPRLASFQLDVQVPSPSCQGHAGWPHRLPGSSSGGRLAGRKLPTCQMGSIQWCRRVGCDWLLLHRALASLGTPFKAFSLVAGKLRLFLSLSLPLLPFIYWF